MNAQMSTRNLWTMRAGRGFHPRGKSEPSGGQPMKTQQSFTHKHSRVLLMARPSSNLPQRYPNQGALAQNVAQLRKRTNVTASCLRRCLTTSASTVFNPEHSPPLHAHSQTILHPGTVPTSPLHLGPDLTNLPKTPTTMSFLSITSNARSNER